ncbi:hypothetical protein FGL91_18630 [Microbacterium sp. CBA3102]|uniref:hypothetical protein n=1 Tax=Microbacterium sp. CBA3102 TaxID=2603598 RepID=UPI0011BB70EA|nr:hypothetical protein [Microbacterium sp. CBA3102]QEA30385.1 hypothetical protein FGL91_18630 [Microbacterium sp. CBA3102]
MGNTKDSFGKPVYDDLYSFPEDSQDAVDFAYEFAWIRGGTSEERQALPAGKQRNGMLWTETDTGRLFRTNGAGSWTPIDDTGWIAVTFQNSWVNAAAGEECEIRRIRGVVYMKGRPALGSAGAAFTLPVGWRPKSIIRALPPTGAGTTTTQVTINTGGTVVLVSGGQPYLGAIAPFPADG